MKTIHFSYTSSRAHCTIIRCLFLICFVSQTALAETLSTCDHWPSWFNPICTRLHDTWTKGNNELYVSGYAWHNRYRYSQEKLNTYNEAAYGTGLGKSYYDDKGNWNGLFAFAFLDSHKYLEPVVGYAFLNIAHLTEKTHVGIGYTVLITQRPDILNGIPFPGILPWASVGYDKFSLSGTYIPGGRNIGNVLYLVGKYVF